MIEKPHCGLLLDPGLGKTSTTLAAASFLMEEGHIHHVLVVAPLRVAQTVWPAEAEKWSDFNHLDVCDLTERDRHMRLQLLKEKYHVYIINPESLSRILELDPWSILDLDMLVIDESTKFKDSSTQRFKALKKCLHKFSRRVILTGTPAPNGLSDLFGQMYVCDMGQSLGKYITHFRQRYMYKGYDGFSWLMAPGSESAIYERVRPKLLRLMAKDHLDMPDLIDNDILVTLPPKVMKQYKELERDFLIKVNDDTVAVFNTAALGTKLRQVANGFIYDEEHTAIHIHEEKLNALAELVEELQGRPLLLCYEFIEDARSIQAMFPQAKNVSESRDISKLIAEFNAGHVPILMGHPKSMGHGLNLQEICKDVCWFGITWDLELYQQAIARVWRQGQPSPVVNNHRIVSVGTKDQDVAASLVSKDISQSKLNDAIKKVVK